MNLTKLTRRWLMYLARRRRQRQLADETGLRGHNRAAAAAGRAMRKIAARAYRVTPGWPYWGGGRALVAEVVRPIAAQRGRRLTSQKRWETYGNPGSDHYKGNRTAYAEDYAAVNDFTLAQEIRSALDPGGIHVDYATFVVTFHGHRFACQIIAGTHGTGPHCHFGCRLID